jgi:hypothetical protein
VSAVDFSLSDGRLYVTFEDATGTVTGEGGVLAPDGDYPAMIAWEMSSGTMLSDDVRALGLALIQLADNADSLNAAGRQSRLLRETLLRIANYEGVVGVDPQRLAQAAREALERD